jgi:hypothetical protein
MHPIPVAEVDVAELSPAAFFERYVARNEPVILRGALRKWGPLRVWSDEYLRRVVGANRLPVRVEPLAGANGVLFGNPRRMQSYHVEEVSMAQLLDELQSERPRFYGARMHLPERMPELLSDMATDGPEAYFGAFGEQQRTNPTCYFGSGRQSTPMHFDPSENLLCVVEGAKEITLFHPADTEHVYPVGERNTHIIYSHLNMCEPPDLATFPTLEAATPHRASVHRGDVLYLPCGWWHAVQGSAGRNMSINYWFALHPHKLQPSGASRRASPSERSVEALLREAMQLA